MVSPGSDVPDGCSISKQHLGFSNHDLVIKPSFSSWVKLHFLPFHVNNNNTITFDNNVLFYHLTYATVIWLLQICPLRLYESPRMSFFGFFFRFKCSHYRVLCLFVNNILRVCSKRLSPSQRYALFHCWRFYNKSTDWPNTFTNVLDKGNEVKLFFLDISKTFVTVWHRGLIAKLE